MVIMRTGSDEVILKPTATDCEEIARPFFEIHLYYKKLSQNIDQTGLWQTKLTHSV
jgi:hypothetical protein